jgi:hypothetical protein
MTISETVLLPSVRPDGATVVTPGTEILSAGFTTYSAVYNGAVLAYTTLAALQANTSEANDTAAIVVGENEANDGLYISTSGTWTRTGGLPFYSFVQATYVSGTDAIVATTDIPVTIYQFIALPIGQTNTSETVTVTFNGGSALTILTQSGTAPAVGGLITGTVIGGYISGSYFRMLSDQASSALQVAAEAAQTAAETAQAAAEAAKDAATLAAESSGDITFYDTYALADASYVGRVEDDVIEIFADETRGGMTTIYTVDSAVTGLDFKLYMGPRVLALSSRTILAGITGAANNVVYLSEAGREGAFQWDASNLSTKVTADAQQGIYLPPTSDTSGASGAWVRAHNGIIYAKWFGAAGDATTDDTAKIQAALDLAYAISAPAVEVTKHAIYGTLTIPAGVTLRGNQFASEYYPGEAAAAINGGYLYKGSSGTAGPIIQMTTGCSLANLYIKHHKTNGATTGIIRMGAVGTSVTCYNTNMTNVTIYGDPTADVTGTNTCYAIYYPYSIGPAQRYFNRGNGIYITYCDVAFHLGDQSNANVYTNFVARQCYHMFEIDGGTGGSVGNAFSGFVCANIGHLPTTQEKVFVLSSNAQFNVFSGYYTECNGLAFDIDSTSTLNYFDGAENEVDTSYAPVGGTAGAASGNTHSRWARPVNIEQYSHMPLPSLTNGSRFEHGLIGSKQSHLVEIDGSGDGLPALDGGGTLVAATAHSRSIIQLDSTVFVKTAKVNFRGKLTVWALAGGTSGIHMCSVEFGYVCTNTATDAGLFEVYEVNQTPTSGSYIAGIKFISGSTGATGMRFALVGGALSAQPAARVVVSLDLDVFHPIGASRERFTDHGFLSTAATANDVTDAIDMLTVGETVV